MVKLTALTLLISTWITRYSVKLSIHIPLPVC